MPTETGVSIAEFIADQQLVHPGARGQFTAVLTSILAGCRFIHRDVNIAGLAGIIGYTGSVNVQGERVRKLDQIARDVIVNHIRRCEPVAAIATEEDEDFIPANPDGSYLVTLDPLDGSSNIDVNVGVGTIFSVWPRLSPTTNPIQTQDFLQPGKNQLVAGYVIYGSSTMLVLTLGNGVFGFTYDPSSGMFLLSHPDIKVPVRSRYYSVNEGNRHSWTPEILQLVFELSRDRSARYIGSLVADFHRNLLKGGIFLYPPDSTNKKGKLRHLYEVAPMTFIIERAGGRGSTGAGNVSDYVPTSLHERVPFYVGNASDVDLVESRLTRG